MFQEFPKAMYRNGEYRAVQSAEEEARFAAQDWTDYHSDRERMAAPQQQQSDLDALRSKANALGIKVHHLWKEPRLREEIAKAQ